MTFPGNVGALPSCNFIFIVYFAIHNTLSVEQRHDYSLSYVIEEPFNIYFFVSSIVFSSIIACKYFFFLLNNFDIFESSNYLDKKAF